MANCGTKVSRILDNQVRIPNIFKNVSTFFFISQELYLPLDPLPSIRREGEVWRFCERDSSGTTEAMKCEPTSAARSASTPWKRSTRREGDGADSPTRAPDAPKVRRCEAARPINFASQNLNEE
jgi:hypothetical protein